MDTQETTVETQADASQLNAAAVDTASSSVAPEAMTLEELNSALGKTFKDKASALKSIGEMNSYVGKKKEDIMNEIMGGEVSKEIKQIKENMFYQKRPELDTPEYRAILSKLDANPEVAANDPSFKSLFEKAVGYDKSQNLKTVLESNPRLASSRDHITKAREAKEAGDSRGAADSALKAVLEAYEL